MLEKLIMKYELLFINKNERDGDRERNRIEHEKKRRIYFCVYSFIEINALNFSYQIININFFSSFIIKENKREKKNTISVLIIKIHFYLYIS